MDAHNTLKTRYGHLEIKVMRCALCNAPATFQPLMEHGLEPVKDECVVQIDKE